MYVEVKVTGLIVPEMIGDTEVIPALERAKGTTVLPGVMIVARAGVVANKTRAKEVAKCLYMILQEVHPKSSINHGRNRM